MLNFVRDPGSRRSHLRWVRIATLVLAFAHWFPASKHVSALVTHPSLDEAWKAVGACLAVVLYLAPPAWQARAIAQLWHRRPSVLSGLSLVLIVVHAVAAIDHAPRFWSRPSWGDGWRAFGAAFAIGWFIAPLRWQHRALARLARLSEGKRTSRV